MLKTLCVNKYNYNFESLRSLYFKHKNAIVGLLKFCLVIRALPRFNCLS
jgi:hypothetical protein